MVLLKKRSEQSRATLFISMKSEPDRSELFATQYSTHGVTFIYTRFLCVKTGSLEQKYVCRGKEGQGKTNKQTKNPKQMGEKQE